MSRGGALWTGLPGARAGPREAETGLAISPLSTALAQALRAGYGCQAGTDPGAFWPQAK